MLILLFLDFERRFRPDKLRIDGFVPGEKLIKLVSRPGGLVGLGANSSIDSFRLNEAFFLMVLITFLLDGSPSSSFR